MLCPVMGQVIGNPGGRTYIAAYSQSLCERGSSRSFLCGNEVRSAKGREKESDLSFIIKEKAMRKELTWGPLG